MSNKDIRWQQRFQNFSKAFDRLKEALEEEELNELERNGLVQRFEFTLELCWNVLKDYLEGEGLQFKPTPKETIRQAFKSGLIQEAQVLIDGLDIRNELSHDYSGEKFEKSETEIRERIFPAIEGVYLFFLTQLKGKQTCLMNNGLTKRDMDTIAGIFSRYPEVSLVHLFGSRAKGTFKAGSDIDLAIMNDGVSTSTIVDLKADFEESSLPYFVDLVCYSSLHHAEMKEHIDRVGVVLYKS